MEANAGTCRWGPLARTIQGEPAQLSLQSAEEAEREKPRLANRWDDAADIHE